MEVLDYYGPNGLAIFLHSLSRYNFKLKPVTSIVELPPDFDFGKIPFNFFRDYPYLQGLAALLLTFVLVGVIYVLAQLILAWCWCCSRACKTKTDMEYEHLGPTSPVLSKAAIAATLVLCLLGCIGTFLIIKGRNDVSRALTQIRSSINDTSDAIDQSVSDGVQIQTNVDSAADFVDVVAQLLPDQPEAQEFQRLVLDMQSNVHDYMSEGESYQIPDTFEEGITTFQGHHALYAIIALAGSFSLIFLVGLRALLKRNRSTALWICKWLGLLLMFALWVAMAAELIASVFTSDICIDPDAVVMQVVQNPDTHDVLEYYIVCDQAIQNPLSAPVANALELLQEGFVRLEDLKQIVFDETISQQLNDVGDLMTSSNDSLLSLHADLDCTRIHNDYIHLLHSLCGDFLTGTFTLFISLCATVLAVAIAKLMICVKSDPEAEWRQAKLVLKFEESPMGKPDPATRTPSILKPLIADEPDQGDAGEQKLPVDDDDFNGNDHEQTILVQVELPQPEYGSRAEPGDLSASSSLGVFGSDDIHMVSVTAQTLEHPFEKQELVIEDELPQVEYVDDSTVKWVKK